MCLCSKNLERNKLGFLLLEYKFPKRIVVFCLFHYTDNNFFRNQFFQFFSMILCHLGKENFTSNRPQLILFTSFLVNIPIIVYCVRDTNKREQDRYCHFSANISSYVCSHLVRWVHPGIIKVYSRNCLCVTCTLY